MQITNSGLRINTCSAYKHITNTENQSTPPAATFQSIRVSTEPNYNPFPLRKKNTLTIAASDHARSRIVEDLGRQTPPASQYLRFSDACFMIGDTLPIDNNPCLGCWLPGIIT